MKLKVTFAAIAATIALTGAMLTATDQAQACAYSEQGGITNTTSFDAPPIDSTTTQADADIDSFNQRGIVGAGFAVLGSLFAGGAILKRRFDRKVEPLEETQTEAFMPEPLFEPSEFAIAIPPEVLQSIKPSEKSDELTSVR